MKKIIWLLILCIIFPINFCKSQYFISPPTNIFLHSDEATISRLDLNEFANFNKILRRFTKIMFNNRPFWKVNAFDKLVEGLLLAVFDSPTNLLDDLSDQNIIEFARRLAKEFHEAFFNEFLELTTDEQITEMQQKLISLDNGQNIFEWDLPQYSWYKKYKILPLPAIIRFVQNLHKAITWKNINVIKLRENITTVRHNLVVNQADFVNQRIGL